MSKEKKSGYEPIKGWKRPCLHMEHEPPTHMVIPPGQQYRHICPGCGQEQVIRGTEVYF